MLLSIIIVSYNTQDLTLKTLQSVADDVDQSPILLNNTEVFVVDNNSQDISVRVARDFFEKHASLHGQVSANFENVGFAKANNQAIQKAAGKYILLLNSDTIVQAGSLTHMVQTFERNPLQETTSVLASQKGKLDRLGILAATLVNK